MRTTCRGSHELIRSIMRVEDACGYDGGMKRLGGIFVRMVTALSFLLCLGSVALWVRSAWVSDILDWSNSNRGQDYYRGTSVCCSRGGVRFCSIKYQGIGASNETGHHFEFTSNAASQYPLFASVYYAGIPVTYEAHAMLGFEWVRDAKWELWPGTDSFVGKSFTFPLYFPSLLFGLLPAHYFLRARQKRRIARRVAAGCCAGCGYDLRASAERCPECGRSVMARK
jgi:hypothetical protein